MIAADNRRAVQSAATAFLSLAAPTAMLGVIWPMFASGSISPSEPSELRPSFTAWGERPQR